MTIDGGMQNGAYVFTQATKIQTCDLHDTQNVFVDHWTVTAKQKYHDGKITVVLIAKDHRQAAALEDGKDRGPPGSILVTTTNPATTTDPNILTTEPVDINPRAR